MPFPATIFVTGTDTGVGKTIVTALLALRLQAHGINVGVMKPFATGCRREGHELRSDDALWLRQILGVEDGLDLINPVRFEEPLAPLVAARRMGNSAFDGIGAGLQSLKALQNSHECVLVEGIGGLLVPLQESANQTISTCADFIELLGAPVVVVARRALGTINHTALTCRVPLRAPSHFAGLVFCDSIPLFPSEVSAQTSPAIISEMTGLSCWGTIPYLNDLTREDLIEAAQQNLTNPQSWFPNF